MLIKDIVIGENRREVNRDKVKELAESIKLIGLVNPILVDKNNKLIAGHHRLLACKELGYTEINSIVFKQDDLYAKLAEIDENLIRHELNYIDRGDLIVERENILSELGLRAEHGNNRFTYRGAESAPLQIETTESLPLKTTESIAKEIGMSERSLQVESSIAKNLSTEVKQIAKEIKLPKEQAIKLARMNPEEQKEVILRIQKGEAKSVKESKKIIQIDERKEVVKDAVVNKNVYNGDSAKVLKTIKDNTVDCVITDPPYGVDYKDSRESFNPEYKDGKDYSIALLDDVCKELKRICKKDSHLYFFTGCVNMFEFKNILKKYFNVQDNPLIWVKNNHTLCDFDSRYASKYEMIWFCCNGEFGNKKLNYSCSPDVLSFDIPRNKQHSAQKPNELIRYLMMNSTVDKEIVLDPFAGSGVTGIVAKNNNRGYILVERELAHYNTIINNLGV
jgi:DNA modification methylase